MKSKDARMDQSRYEVALEELTYLQKTLPGKVAIVAFSDNPVFVPGGCPPMLGKGTDVAGTLRFVQPADGTVRFILISDGEPDDEWEALKVAAEFTSRIDCIYVGPEGDRRGAGFLERLAKQGRGKYVKAGLADQLCDSVIHLLSAGEK